MGHEDEKILSDIISERYRILLSSWALHQSLNRNRTVGLGSDQEFDSNGT
jgi:hypothetical protein